MMARVMVVWCGDGGGGGGGLTKVGKLITVVVSFTTITHSTINLKP